MPEHRIETCSGRIGRAKQREVPYGPSEITCYWLLGCNPNDGVKTSYSDYSPNRRFTTQMSESGLLVGLRDDGQVFTADYDMFMLDGVLNSHGYKLSRFVVGAPALTALDYPEVGRYKDRRSHPSHYGAQLSDYSRWHPSAVWAKGDGGRIALKRLLQD